VILAMKTPFILRFEEACAQCKDGEVSAGTQTITNVRAEAGDSDDKGRRFEALENPAPGVGTMTRTAVAREGSDDDRSLSPQGLLPEVSPMVLGTQTMTRTQGESADQDPAAGRHRALLPC
jgi:hypothetical protein